MINFVLFILNISIFITKLRENLQHLDDTILKEESIIYDYQSIDKETLINASERISIEEKNHSGKKQPYSSKLSKYLNSSHSPDTNFTESKATSRRSGHFFDISLDDL